MPRWLRWTVLAMLSWGVWAIMAKLIGEALSGAHNQALSTLGILPIMIAIAFSKRDSAERGHSCPQQRPDDDIVAKKPQPLEELGVAADRNVRAPGCGKRRVGIFHALLGGAISCLGNVVYYDALSRGSKAAMIVPLTALYPLMTILLAMLLLKERLNRVQLVGVFMSLIAIYFFNVQREEGFFSHWLLYALAPIALWGASAFLQKLSTNHITGELSTVWFLGAFIPFGVLFLLGEPLPAHISARTWLLVLAQGFFLAFGNLAVLRAFAEQGKASIVTPLAALYPLVSIPIAIGFLDERIGVREAIAIALALVSVLALSQETPPRAAGNASNGTATQTAP